MQEQEKGIEKEKSSINLQALKDGGKLVSRDYEIGQRVLVEGKHWLWGHQRGTIIQVGGRDISSGNIYLVRMDKPNLTFGRAVPMETWLSSKDLII